MEEAQIPHNTQPKALFSHPSMFLVIAFPVKVSFPPAACTHPFGHEAVSLLQDTRILSQSVQSAGYCSVVSKISRTASPLCFELVM